MSTGRRRQLLHTALVVALGFLTALAIAWGLAAFRPIPKSPRTVLGAFERWGIPWHIGRIDEPGLTEVWWMDLRIDSLPAEPSVIVGDSRDLDAETAKARPGVRLDDRPQRWGTFARGSPPPPAYQIGSDTAFGWPFPCFWYQVFGVSGRDAQNHGTIQNQRLVGALHLRGEVSARIHDFHALPLLFRWPSLLADTGLFAVFWWILLWAPSAIRRRARRRRGRCVACGYDLSGTAIAAPCPECGAARGGEHASVLSPPRAS